MINSIDELRTVTKRYLDYDNAIKQLRLQIKELKIKQAKDELLISAFMEKNEIEDLNSANGTLRYKVTNRFTPLSQKKSIVCIKDFYKNNENQADNLINYLLSKRQSKQIKKLTRIKNKSSKKVQII